MFKSFKKVISTLAAVAMLATSASAFAVDFPDVDKSASYAGAVNTLTALGVVNGDDNGKFNPDNTVTRAEFTKMVVEAIGEGSAAASSSYTKFADAKSHWAAGYIETGVAKGFINGYDENSFGPDDQVTYAQAVKMLVAAIGYTTYAENNGGWPSGYLAYGSSLDIIAGVTGVSNDTALTRAQCAVLISNTLEAPICKVNGYNKDFQGNWYPNYEEMDGTGKGWQTLLTTQHNAYVVKGRVTSVDKNKNEVTYKVEAAENFDGIYYTGVAQKDVSSATRTLPEVKVGDTNAADMLFEYSEAILQKDKSTNKYTLISIAPYGATETVEFAAADIADNGVDTAKNVIKLKKDGTSSTKDYKIDNATTKLYVNGTEINGNTTTDDVTKYSFATAFAKDIAKKALSNTNVRGTVTLVDSSEVASTATDGTYDYVMVTYYEAAKVSSVKVADDDIRIRTDISSMSIEWDPTDTEKNVTITKDGVEISAEDVKEDDIILVSYDKAKSEDIKDSKWVDIQVSDKTVSGTATGKSTTGKKYLLVDGEKYEFNNADDIATIALNKAYTLYLDAMGYVYDYDVDEASKNIGIVAQMYQPTQDDTPTVVLIDGNGDVQTYLTKNTTDSDSIKAQVNSSDDKNLVKKLKGDSATLNKRFIQYRISNGKLVYEKNAEPEDVESGSEFKTSTSKLGSYTIDETATTIIDLDAYLTGEGEPMVYPYSSLENENTYTGFVADRNKKTGIYGFAVLTRGTSSLRPTSSLAVVTASGSVTLADDGANVEVLTVARDGEEDIEVLVENTSSAKEFATVAPEGSIVMYKVGADGYVKNGDLKVIYSPATDYDTFATNMFETLTSDSKPFTEVADNSKFLVANAGKYTLDINGDDTVDKDVDTDVEIFIAPVYSATSSVLQILTKKTFSNNGTAEDTKDDYTVASVKDIKDLTLAGANVYTYNCDKAKVSDGISVSIGGIAQRIDTYKDMYQDAPMNLVDMSKVSTAITKKYIAPAFAFVRVDDGDVTDVLYIVKD